MPGGNVTITGLDGVLDHLQALGQEKGRKVIRKALRKGGGVMRDAIAQRAPIRVPSTSGTALPPGALARDFRVAATRDEAGNLAVAIKPGKATARVARWVEYGHRDVHGGYSKKKKDGTFRGPGKAGATDVPEHPFIRPAYEGTVEEMIDVTAESLIADMERAATGAEVA